MVTFVETTDFSRQQSRFLPGQTYVDFQKELIAHPDKGDVMPGCGGLRKLRIADPVRRKGKRGGARVIYLHIPEVNQFLMLDIYGEDEKDDLTPAEKKSLRELARQYKQVVVRASKRRGKENRS